VRYAAGERFCLGETAAAPPMPNISRESSSADWRSTDDTSVMTAVANDYGYERLFARQIQALGRKGDVFIAISTSGRSPNVLQGLEEARRMELVCVGFTGASGGRMPAACDICLHVPAQETPRIQEGHIIAGHIVCGLVEAALFERPKT